MFFCAAGSAFERKATRGTSSTILFGFKFFERRTSKKPDKKDRKYISDFEIFSMPWQVNIEHLGGGQAVISKWLWRSLEADWPSRNVLERFGKVSKQNFRRIYLVLKKELQSYFGELRLRGGRTRNQKDSLSYLVLQRNTDSSNLNLGFGFVLGSFTFLHLK